MTHSRTANREDLRLLVRYATFALIFCWGFLWTARILAALLGIDWFGQSTKGDELEVFVVGGPFAVTAAAALLFCERTWSRLLIAASGIPLLSAVLGALPFLRLV